MEPNLNGEPDPCGPQRAERTIAFVDFAGFTALTETHGDYEAAAIMDRFVAIARRSMSASDEMVKSVGDAIMTASLDPLSALQALSRLLRSCRNETGFPILRAGAHHGLVITRDGDYLGATVNLAARVCGEARPGQLLVTGVVAGYAESEPDNIGIEQLGARRLRNIANPVALYSVRIYDDPSHGPIDPVCRMHIPGGHGVRTAEHQGQQYWFCSDACAEAFTANPANYLSIHGA